MKTLVYRRNIDDRFYSVKLGDILLDIFGGGWNDTDPCLHRVTYFITVRKRSLGQGNIFISVCHSVHRGEYLTRYTPPDQVHHPPWDQVHPPGPGTPSLEQTPQSRSPWARYTPGTKYPPGTKYTPLPGTEYPPPPPGSRLRHTVNAGAVRILLECILVNNGFLAQLLLERLAYVIIIPPNQILLLNMLFISLLSATVVAERLCFHKRLSFCPGGEVYTSRADTFLDTHPLGHTPDGHCSRRYASYWNAFLLNMSLKNVHNGTLLTALTTLMTRSREISCSFCH